MEHEKTLYRVSGELPKGFQGHITYTTIFPPQCNAMKVKFVFDKREPVQTQELAQQCRQAFEQNESEATLSEPLLNQLCQMPKGEINLSVFSQDACLGTAHRNQLEKEFEISPSFASDGFSACKPQGIIKIVLHALHVVNDETHYTLEVKGGVV